MTPRPDKLIVHVTLTGQDAADIDAIARAGAGSKPKMGRPRIGEPPRPRPWEDLGMSRRTWGRRQKEKRQ